MSNVNTVISDFTSGSSLTVRRTVTRIPNGSFIQTAVLTVKATENGSENGGVIAKTIRTFDQSGVGQVENQGGTGTCQLRFELTQTDTRQLPPDQPYYYWIDVFLDADSGESTTVENGLIIATVAPTLRQKDDTVPHQEQQHKDHQQQQHEHQEQQQQQNGNGIWYAARDARRAIEARARELMKLSADAKESGDVKAMDGADAELADLRQQYKRHSVAERAACIAHTCALNESLPAQLEAAQLAQWELEAEYEALLSAQERERAELAGKVDQAKAKVFDNETQLAGNSRTFNEAEAGFHAAIQRVLSRGEPFV